MAPGSHWHIAFKNALHMHRANSSMKKRDAMLNLLLQWQSTISIRCVWALPAPFHFCIPLLGRNLLLWGWMWASDRRAQGSDVWKGGGHSLTRANCLVIFLWSHNLDWNRHIQTNANTTSTTAHHANNNNLFFFFLPVSQCFLFFFYMSFFHVHTLNFIALLCGFQEVLGGC